MAGRPSDYDDALAAMICERIATTPRGLDFICAQDESLPAPSTIANWLNTRPEFVERYLRARERQADLIFDECLEIADEASRDTKTGRDGAEVMDGEWVARSKLRVDTRLRMAGKLAPKKYGDRTIHAGDDKAPIMVADVTDLERAKAVAALVAKAAAPKPPTDAD